MRVKGTKLKYAISLVFLSFIIKLLPCYLRILCVGCRKWTCGWEQRRLADRDSRGPSTAQTAGRLVYGKNCLSLNLLFVIVIFLKNKPINKRLSNKVFFAICISCKFQCFDCADFIFAAFCGKTARLFKHLDQKASKK